MKLPGHLRILILLPAIFLAWKSADAQEDYRYDIGGGVGISSYLGDAQTSLFASPGISADLQFRYRLNPRFSFKSYLSLAQLKGNTQATSNWIPGEHRSFSVTPISIGETAEFNFFNYGIGEAYLHLLPVSPYLSAGLGVCAWSIDGSMHAAMELPIGLGVKYTPAPRWNIGAELTMKKIFSDKVDGASLSDPYGIKSSLMKNTDWISGFTLSVSYEFSQRCATCNYKD